MDGKWSNISIKKVLTIGVLFIFLVSFITHNIYEWAPSMFTFSIFPINESIWEHQKMIFSAYLMWGIVEYIILKRNGLESSNVTLATVLTAVFNIGIFILVYTPVYIIFGHNMLVTLSIYFFTITISQPLNYYLLKRTYYHSKWNILALLFVAFIWFCFNYLSYFPIRNYPLFYDGEKAIYGQD